MKYSLINVYKEHDGFVDGTWIQNYTGTFEGAIKAARDTERVNGYRISVAVVDDINICYPDYNPRKGLKRLDLEKLN